MRRAIRAWEAKLVKFSDKFGNNPEVLKNSPVWNKLLMILSSLVQLAEAEEMRLSILYETRQVLTSQKHESSGITNLLYNIFFRM